MQKFTCEKCRQIKSLGIIIAILGILLFSSDLYYNNLNSLFLLDCQNLKISQEELLYTEDFDDGVANQWVTIGGTWIVENNHYKATGANGERVRSYYSGQSFNNYFYEGDLKLVSGDEIQLIFNVQDVFSGVDQGHYCQITLFYDDPGDRKDTAILYSTQNGQTEHNQTSYDFNHNQWYHFKVISIGSYVAFFLNDSLILSYSGLFYSSGYIGVKSMYGPTAYWDNIKVSKVNESDILNGNGNDTPPFPFEGVMILTTLIIVGISITGIAFGVKKIKYNAEVKKSRLPKDEVARYKKLKELERQGKRIHDESPDEKNSD